MRGRQRRERIEYSMIMGGRLPIGFWSFFAGAVFAAASPAALLQTPDPQTATFHAGTRLVEDGTSRIRVVPLK